MSALPAARQAQSAGDFRRAEMLAQQALQADPVDGAAWLLLAAACLGQGKLPEAAAAAEHALRLRPDDPDAHFRLGAVRAGQGQRPEAVDHFRQAMRLRPEHFDALLALGIALAEQGSLAEAVGHLTAAVRARPDSAPARYNLGVALAQQGKLEEAEPAFREALRLSPGYAAAHYGLGNVLTARGRREEAVACFRAALSFRPDYGEAYNNLGLALTELRRPAEAVVLLRQAVRLRPGAAEGHNNLGLALSDLGRFEEAEAAFHEALRLNPKYAEAHTNLGSAFKEQGRTDEALACYQVALWLQPDSASTHWNRALAWLQAGDFERGWPEYEWRWQRTKTPPRRFPQPAWDGSPLAGRTLLIYMEQGLGDMLQFIRYAALAQPGGRVVVECPGILRPLFSRCRGIDQLVAEGDPLPPFDVHAPLLSLPRLLKTTLATVPAEVPYLFPDPGRVETWGRRLPPGRDFKIGVAWQGNPHHQWDRHRSFPLAKLAPLAGLPGVRLVSLQKGPGIEQLRAAPFPVTALAEDLDASGGAFEDTAAVLRHLDLVVTPDTALAHLAGGMGVPAWVALAAVSDWRWLLGREDSPWYPSLRLFRQARLGDWEAVFERMAAELRPRQPGSEVWAKIAPGELVDKVTILEIKARRITDPAKAAQVAAELAALRRAGAGVLGRPEELERLTADLKAVNEALWDIEDELRRCEKAGEFGNRFVELARSVYRRNDERAAFKRRINELLGAPFGEQKSYPSEG
jgi:tetratricopeptide (TPR) repeat protein